MSGAITSSLISTRAIYPDRSEVPLKIASASGSFVFDTEGRSYLDAALGSGSMILGHGDDEIVATLADQARNLAVHPGAGFAFDLVDRYATRLIEFAPEGYDRVSLASSGSDAVEMALKLAIQFHHLRGDLARIKIIGREASYHGNSLAGLAAGQFLARRMPYENFLPQTTKAACALCSRCAFQQTPDTCSLECASSIAAAIEREGAEHVAAVILEPVTGAALSGAVPDARYFKRVREICDHYGVLLIADEVMSGFGRTGRNFAIEHWDAEPDLIICGKGMGAGHYPLSGLIISTKVAAAFELAGVPTQHGQTHGCNPIGAAVGLAVIDRLERDGLAATSALLGDRLREMLARELPPLWPSEVRGLGLMTGVELYPRDGLLPEGLARSVQRAAREAGLLIYPSSGGPNSTSGEHFLLLPALTIDMRHIEHIVSCLREAFVAISDVPSGDCELRAC